MGTRGGDGGGDAIIGRRKSRGPAILLPAIKTIDSLSSAFSY